MAPCYGWRSPHTRGARGQALRRLGPRRIIPAYAGSTGPPPAETQRRLHHPRIRGEHDVFADQVAQTKGSSPHTRGAPSPVSRQPTIRRIIPAYAGSTAAPPRRRAMKPDHPRIRGEHAAFLAKVKALAGSSPHTRGARESDGCERTGARIIPAYAGSTNGPSSRPPPKADHPRIRGEHDGNRPASQEREGSSPHTRGAPTHPRHPRHNQRIIPAYAGSTHRLGCAGDFGRDHPRIRGEHHD